LFGVQFAVGHPSLAKSFVMEMPTEVARFQALLYDGKPKPPGITVTVRPWWFQIRSVRHVKPSAIQVKRWWDIIRKPATDLDLSTQLHMIRRAMLEWPKMGAAIGKLAQQEHQLAKKQCKALQRQALNKFKKMVKNPVPEMILGDQTHSASIVEKATKSAKSTGRRERKHCKK
jgi:hypothetical protein